VARHEPPQDCHLQLCPSSASYGQGT
jgi:hypothetical protein